MFSAEWIDAVLNPIIYGGVVILVIGIVVWIAGWWLGRWG